MTIKGTLHKIFHTQQVSEKFRKREFIMLVAENQQYPDHIKLEMIQDNCDHLDGYKCGDLIEADINIKGREWTDPQGVVKYFNTLQAWRLRKQEGNQQQQNT